MQSGMTQTNGSPEFPGRFIAPLICFADTVVKTSVTSIHSNLSSGFGYVTALYMNPSPGRSAFLPSFLRSGRQFMVIFIKDLRSKSDSALLAQYTSRRRLILALSGISAHSASSFASLAYKMLKPVTVFSRRSTVFHLYRAPIHSSLKPFAACEEHTTFRSDPSPSWFVCSRNTRPFRLSSGYGPRV